MKEIAFINTLPKAPDMNDSVDFDKDADNFVKALVPFSKELNELIKDLNTLSASLFELNAEMISYNDLTLKQNTLKLENLRKDLQNTLENEAKKRIQDFTNDCLQAIEAKGYEMIQRLNDNDKGADYVAISYILAHSLSTERFIMEKGLIKLSLNEETNLILKGFKNE